MFNLYKEFIILFDLLSYKNIGLICQINDENIGTTVFLRDQSIDPKWPLTDQNKYYHKLSPKRLT